MKKTILTMTLCCLAGLFCAAILAGGEAPAGQPSAAEVVRKALVAGGIEKAKQAFTEMRRAPQGSYLFSEKEFLELGDGLAGEGRAAEAVAILQLCLEVFPDSPDILSALARSCRAAGDEPSSYKYFRLAVAARGKLQLQDFLEKNRGKLAATAAEVIQRHLEATGGEKAWRDIRTMTVKFSVHDTSGNSGTLVRHYKRPNFYRQGFEGAQSFHSTDGKTVWRVTNGEWKEIEESPYIRMASIDDSLIDYGTAGVTYDLVGVEILNHAPVYHLKRTFRDNYQEDLYFSITAGYLTEKLTPYNIGPTYFTFWDYRQAGGILVPHVMIRNLGDMAPPHGLVLKEIRIDEPLDDSLFVKPAK